VTSTFVLDALKAARAALSGREKRRRAEASEVLDGLDR
jgi:hypothetical protein